MKRTNFSGLNSQQKQKKTLNLNGFKGVDYTSPTFEVDQNRAIDILNFIRKENVLEKRDGYNHIAALEGLNIHNVWLFNNKYVVNASGSIFIYSKSFESKEKSFSNIVKDQFLNAFYRNKKLWILGGIKFLVIDSDFNIQNVEDIAEIPTTTIGIAPNNLANVSDTNRESYDSFNNLTYFHVNELSSGITENNILDISTVLKYTLDSVFKLKNDVDISKMKVEISYNNALETIGSLKAKKISLYPALSFGEFETNQIVMSPHINGKNCVSLLGDSIYLWAEFNADQPLIERDFLFVGIAEGSTNKNAKVEDLVFEEKPVSDFYYNYSDSSRIIVMQKKSDTGKYTLAIKQPGFTFAQTDPDFTYKEKFIRIRYGTLVSDVIRFYKLKPKTLTLATFDFSYTAPGTNGKATINVKWNEFNALNNPKLTIKKYRIKYPDDSNKDPNGIPYQWDQNYILDNAQEVQIGQNFTLEWIPAYHECFAYDGVIYDANPESVNITGSIVNVIKRREK